MLHSNTICITYRWYCPLSFIMNCVTKRLQFMCNITLGEVTHTKKKKWCGLAGARRSTLPPSGWGCFPQEQNPDVQAEQVWSNTWHEQPVSSQSLERFTTYIKIHSRTLVRGVLSYWSVGVEIIDIRFLKAFIEMVWRRRLIVWCCRCLKGLSFQQPSDTPSLSCTCMHARARVRSLAELRSIAPQLSPWVKLAYRSRCSPCEESDLHIMQHQSSVKTANVC